MSAAVWKERVEAELREVMDPCSCLTPTPLNIVDLGLVREVSVEPEQIEVSLGMTDPMCLYFPDIATEIKRRVGDLGWEGSVSVQWDTAADWSPERMSPAARRARLAARRRLEQLTPLGRTSR
jgi:metal-sulfur cluster biosynthetic enzyme